jgi:predicted CXXCH cytochrome family protein
MRSLMSGASPAAARTTGRVGGDSHPFGIPYPYNRARNTYNGITTAEAALTSGWTAAPEGLKLYMDPAAPPPFNRGIECASCHDPHGSPYRKLLRASSDGDLCERCHRH